MSRPMRPSWPEGSPPPSFCHVSPPSDVLKIALPGPLSMSRQGRRCLSYIAAYRTAGDSRFDHEIDRARFVVHIKDALPRATAVDGAKNAALGVLRKKMSHRGDVDAVRVPRIDHDSRDVMRIGQPHELPRLAAIGGLEDAAAGIGTTRVRLIPVPTQTVLLSEGAIPIAPIGATPALSKTGTQVTPPFVVFQTPPLRCPTHMVYRCSWTGESGTATVVTHAPERNGPIFRSVSLSSTILQRCRLLALGRETGGGGEQTDGKYVQRLQSHVARIVAAVSCRRLR